MWRSRSWLLRASIATWVVILLFAARAAGASDCTDRCWSTFQYCLSNRTAQATCYGNYSECRFRCFAEDLSQPSKNPPPENPRFNNTVVGTTLPPWIPKVWNDKGRHSTLYMSFDPPVPGDIGRHSEPVRGPFGLCYGRRWELKPGEGQKVCVSFTPTEAVESKTTVYMWWDVRGAFRWHGVYHFSGLGVPPPPPQAGTPSGRQGGLETFPLWMFQPVVAMPGPIRRPPALWRNVSGNAAGGSRQRSAGRGTRAELMKLTDLLPASVGGLTPVFQEPESIIGGSNALEALSADYVDPVTGAVRAAVLGFRTRNDVYAHVYGVCSRVKGSWLESVRFPSAPVSVDSGPVTFWESTSNTPAESGARQTEVATSFAVFVSRDGRRFTLDSRWLSEEYPLHPDRDGDVLTFQVWAPDTATMHAARDAVIENLRKRGTIEYRNTAPRPAPDLLMNAATYELDGATIVATNTTAAPREVEFNAITWSAANPQSESRTRFPYTLAPGTQTINLPLPAQLNGVIYMNEKGSPWTDMVYVADGSWFSFGESGPPPWTAPTCPAALHGPLDLPSAGCARLVTAIPENGWRGIGRGVNTYTRAALDLGDAKAVSFFARGTEQTSEVRLISRGADGSRLEHVAFFTPTAEGRQITIPFTGFDGAGAAEPFAGDRLLEITWNVAGSQYDQTDLTIGNVFFTPDLVLESAPPAIAGDAYGVTTRVAGELESPAATLAYRRRGESTFVRVPMQQNEDLWSASIPAQPGGTLLESYTEVRDASGRVATSPPDAPYETQTLVVSERPMAVVDDFTGRQLRNLQGGVAWTFRGTGGVLQSARTGEALRLTYDVRTPGSFAGWVSPFRRAIDTTAYDALLLRVRGGSGGERVKIGLGDSAGREHKLILAKFLSGGVTSGWSDVRVPLAAFTTVDRRSIQRIVVVFESTIGSGSGVVDLDDVVFSATNAIAAVPVENFDDGSQETALGGSFWTATGGTATLTSGHDAAARYGSTGSGYRVTVSGGVSSWATVGFDLRGLDARAFQRLRLAIRGARGQETPNIYLVSGTGGQEVRRAVDIERFQPVSTAWQRIAIPLADFASQGVDLSNLTRLEIVWEWVAFSDTVDLDEIELVRD